MTLTLYSSTNFYKYVPRRIYLDKLPAVSQVLNKQLLLCLKEYIFAQILNCGGP